MALQAIVRRLVRAAERLELVATQASLVGMGLAVKVGVRTVRRERRHAPAAGRYGGEDGKDKDGEQQSAHGGDPRQVKSG